MTLNTNVGRNEYIATSSQTIFNYTFKIYDTTDLDVFVTPAGQVCGPGDLTTNYTVLGVDAEGGGSITLATPATTGDLVTIVSSIPSSRTTDYQNNGDFRPATVNDDIDRVLSIAKQAVDKANRAVTFPDCQQSVTSLTMPNPVDSSFLKWKSNLSGLENHTFNATGIQNDVSVETLAALRALTSSSFSDGQAIIVTNDGIAGVYIVKTGSITDNDDTLVEFTDDSNRYAELAFGAKRTLTTVVGFNIIASFNQFIYLDGFTTSGDGGDCWWVLKGFNAGKAGDAFSLSLMELYDKEGNIYEPYGTVGSQKLEIKPNAVGAVGDFSAGSGTDNILAFEALRDYLQTKGGGVVLLARGNVYGISRVFKMGTLRFTTVDYRGSGTTNSASNDECGFGKLSGFPSNPATTATLDSVVRMNANDFTDSVGTFEGWQCSDFVIRGEDGVNNISCLSVVGAVRGCTVDNIRTFAGYDGIALTSCFGHIFTRNLSTGATRTGHQMGDGAFGVINDVVVNVATFTGNTATNCGDWGLHYRFGNTIGMNANTYEINDKNVWIQDVKSGNISNLYVEAANGVDEIQLKIGGNIAESGIVFDVSFDGVIAAFGNGKKVLIRGANSCEFSNFRLDSSNPITSDNAGENRIDNNKFRNATHDTTISKTKNVTDTNFEDLTSNMYNHQSFSGGTGFQGSFFLNTVAATPVTMSASIKSGMLLVTGELDSNNTFRWTDVVYFCTGGSIVSEAKTTRGSPPTRTYTMVSGNPTIETSADSMVSIMAFGYN